MFFTQAKTANVGLTQAEEEGLYPQWSFKDSRLSIISLSYIIEAPKSVDLRRRQKMLR